VELLGGPDLDSGRGRRRLAVEACQCIEACVRLQKHAVGTCLSFFILNLFEFFHSHRQSLKNRISRFLDYLEVLEPDVSKS
jgi:hypothetical protein